jgi:hypothetical protein
VGLLAWAAVPTVHSNGQTPSNLDVRVGFVINFAKFVYWPGDTTNKAIRLCATSGDDLMSKNLSKFQGGLIRNRPVLTKTLATSDNPAECEVLFISSNYGATETLALLSALETTPTLTISDREDFARIGGMMELVPVRNRYQFDINYSAAKRAGLTLESGLLRLARSVK